jgi:hypothetical protein
VEWVPVAGLAQGGAPLHSPGSRRLRQLLHAEP